MHEYISVLTFDSVRKKWMLALRVQELATLFKKVQPGVTPRELRHFILICKTTDHTSKVTYKEMVNTLKVNMFAPTCISSISGLTVATAVSGEKA